jgi:general secretion pathway protein D
LLAEKLIHDIDKAKPEVVIQVAVLQARRDRLRDLGIQPDTTGTLVFTPRSFTTPAPTTGPTTIPLNKLIKKLSTADYSVRLPGATATALLTDSTTKIIQNPEIRVVDGQSAKLRVGDRVPVATGSFQAGVGVGVAGAVGGGIVNPLVNTQFQYIDVGVNVDITPRIHPNHEISMKVSIEVSSVTGRVSIGGIEQPIISQRKIDHDVRLLEGEVNILGGLIERTETKSLTGWPGLARVPLLRYFFSGENIEKAENEVLIVLIPRIVRLPQIAEANLHTLSAGTETNVQVRRESEAQAPPPAAPAPPPAAGAAPGAAQGAAPGTEGAHVARLRFEPQSVTLRQGETTTIAVVVEDVHDLFSIPMLLQYNPAVISVEEVRHGGFLSGGTQEIAIVQRVDKERGQAIISATRQPNTPGVNGTGTLLGIVIRGLASGTSSLAVLQVNAHDSEQKPIALVSGEASIRVQ